MNLIKQGVSASSSKSNRHLRLKKRLERPVSKRVTAAFLNLWSAMMGQVVRKQT
jgi:hypothetical protein